MLSSESPSERSHAVLRQSVKFTSVLDYNSIPLGKFHSHIHRWLLYFYPCLSRIQVLAISVFGDRTLIYLPRANSNVSSPEITEKASIIITINKFADNEIFVSTKHIRKYAAYLQLSQHFGNLTKYYLYKAEQKVCSVCFYTRKYITINLICFTQYVTQAIRRTESCNHNA